LTVCGALRGRPTKKVSEMRNVPPHILRQIQDAIRQPEGTVTFKFQSIDLFDKSKPGGILLQIPSDPYLFRLERDDALCMHFYHSTPGTGTRIATIDLNGLPVAPSVFIAFSWSSHEIRLCTRPEVAGAQLVCATGVPSCKQFRIGRDGSVYQYGDLGVDVWSVNAYQAGQPVLQPTAIEAWRETLRAIQILSTGQSPEGYIFEVVTTNLTLAMIVTGFEAYTKKRFIEIEQEGITPDINRLVEAFLKRREREVGILDILKSSAKAGGVSVLQYFVDQRRINFQNYDCCKLAYKRCYGIQFGRLGVLSDNLKRLRLIIGYRHKIVHISPLLGLLNQEKVPPQEPVFPNKQTAEAAKECFGELIEKLHQATLSLKA
jgi:hypothetical protein